MCDTINMLIVYLEDCSQLNKIERRNESYIPCMGMEKALGYRTSAFSIEYVVVEMCLPSTENLDFMRVCGTVVMNTRTKNPLKSSDFSGFLQLFLHLSFLNFFLDPNLTQTGIF